VKTEKGRQILTLDYQTMEYRPQQKPHSFGWKPRAGFLTGGTHSHALRRHRQGGPLAWDILARCYVSAADRLTEIAADVSRWITR